MLCYVYVAAGAARSGERETISYITHGVLFNKRIAVLMYTGATASRWRRKSSRIDVRRHYDIPMMVQRGRQESSMGVNADTFNPRKWEMSGGCGIPWLSLKIKLKNWVNLRKMGQCVDLTCDK